jgi:predicted dehydrogenase
LEEAWDQASPDAVVIATPVSTHLPLTRACLSHGVAVMVEKPLAISGDQLSEYALEARERPESLVQVGYVMPRNPQISSSLEALHTGRFGNVLGFLGLTLVSLIREAKPGRWEVEKEVSGGGSLINAGGHVLSMIRAAFGDPQSVTGQFARLYSSEVEDSAVVKLAYPEFSGTHFCSWSIQGFPRQENTLIVWTDRGRLLLTGSVGVFVGDDGECDVTHQLDFDVGFNLAPDYAGAGFTTELEDLAKAARTRRPAPMDLQEGIRIEQLLFKVYQESKPVETFDGAEAVEFKEPEFLRLKASTAGPGRNPEGIRRFLDLRDLPTASLASAGWINHEWDGYVVNPLQVRLASQGTEPTQLRVTVPDFLKQSRLLSMGRHIEVLKQLGPWAVLGAASTMARALLKERRVTFWVAAMGLLRAGLEQIPRDFCGTLLLHGYLTDLALAVGFVDKLDDMLAICRRQYPHVRVGLHSNMAEELSNALQLLATPVDEISVLTSPNAKRIDDILAGLRRSGKGRDRTLVAEIGLAPALVHRLALGAPERWAHGADAVLFGIDADVRLGGEVRRACGKVWQEAFPGVSPPDYLL